MEDGTVIVSTYDWKSYLKDFILRLPGIKEYHHFQICSHQPIPGIIGVKENYDDDKFQLYQLLKCPSNKPDRDKLPPEVMPSGLNSERQWYLYDQIREFCSDSCKDIVAPLPMIPRPSAQVQLETACVDEQDKANKHANRRGRPIARGRSRGRPKGTGVSRGELSSSRQSEQQGSEKLGSDTQETVREFESGRELRETPKGRSRGRPRGRQRRRPRGRPRGTGVSRGKRASSPQSQQQGSEELSSDTQETVSEVESGRELSEPQKHRDTYDLSEIETSCNGKHQERAREPEKEVHVLGDLDSMQ